MWLTQVHVLVLTIHLILFSVPTNPLLIICSGILPWVEVGLSCKVCGVPFSKNGDASMFLTVCFPLILCHWIGHITCLDHQGVNTSLGDRRGSVSLFSGYCTGLTCSRDSVSDWINLFIWNSVEFFLNFITCSCIRASVFTDYCWVSSC